MYTSSLVALRQLCPPPSQRHLKSAAATQSGSEPHVRHNEPFEQLTLAPCTSATSQAAPAAATANNTTILNAPRGGARSLTPTSYYEQASQSPLKPRHLP
jgi:hypothetical protein